MPFVPNQTHLNVDHARIAGVKAHCMQEASIRIGGVGYAPAEIIQVYQDDLDAAEQVAQAKSALKGALSRAGRIRASTQAFDATFKCWIEGSYAGQLAVLDDFGLVLKTRATPSAETKAKAAEKAQITKAARYGAGKT
jgi:hypothetical protein